MGYEYILMVVDYVSIWLEVIVTRTSHGKVVTKFNDQNIFTWFGCPGPIITDGGLHFTKFKFRSFFRRYGVQNRITTPYHPQANGQVELCNRQINKILQKVVKPDG